MAKSEVKQAAAEKIYEIVNESSVVVSSGQIRIMPKGAAGDHVRIPESKISEGLKRLLAIPTSGLKKKLVE